MCLPGYLELDANDLSRVCAVYSHYDADGSSSYIVEFQFQEDAARYAKAARKARRAVARSMAAACTGSIDEAMFPSPALYQLPEASEGYQLPEASGLLQSPPGLNPSSSLDLPSWHEVEICDLPKRLMSQKMLEVTLEQAGLENDVVSMTFLGPGKVHIHFCTRHAAEGCVEHFHGRKWNPAGAAVTAKVVSDNLVAETQPELPSAASASGLNKYAPAYVHSALGKKSVGVNRKRSGLSDASTTVSDEDAEEESWEADLKKVMAGCAFV